FDRCRKTPGPHPPGGRKVFHIFLPGGGWMGAAPRAEIRRCGGCLGSWPHGKPATTAQRGQAAHRAGKSASRSVTTPEPSRWRVRSRYIYRRDIPSSSATASTVLTPTFSCSANLAITRSYARACSHSASDIFSLVHMTTDRMVFRSRRHIPGHRGPSVPTPSDSDSNSKTALLGCTLKTLGGRVTPPSLLRDEIRQRWRRDEPKVGQIQFQSRCRCL